jgi:2-polyprenyl-3-methyl-5-hydroxy-6-metoxy-1,4-benzoquinol methylase
MSIVTDVNQNEARNIQWVTEFFDGKYTEDQVKHFLYHQNPNEPRAGVMKLVDEFNSINSNDTEELRKWYIDTDFYVFDLLPWNGSGQFEHKLQKIKSVIEKYGFKTIVDFGGGLGVASAWLKQECNVDVIYVDLPDSVTSKFAKFLFGKLNLDIPMMTDEEFFNSHIKVDMISAMDCFEHIPNMDETFDKLTEHSYVIMHDSTFFRDRWSPQHVYTPDQRTFTNMALLRNYVIRDDPSLLWRAYLVLENNNQITLKFV